MNLVETKVALPTEVVERALKQGRVAVHLENTAILDQTRSPAGGFRP